MPLSSPQGTGNKESIYCIIGMGDCPVNIKDIHVWHVKFYTLIRTQLLTNFRQASTAYGELSDMETEKWLVTLLVRVWTSLDLGSTSYIKRYRFANIFQIITYIHIYDNLVHVYAYNVHFMCWWCVCLHCHLTQWNNYSNIDWLIMYSTHFPYLKIMTLCT